MNLRNYLGAECRTIREEMGDESEEFLQVPWAGGLERAGSKGLAKVVGMANEAGQGVETKGFWVKT